MDAETIKRLNQINHDFYRVVADDFDQTRGAAWSGWERLLPHLAAPLSVLDVGCGNGRFGLFLGEHLTPVTYHGLDSSPALLERARAALKSQPGIDVRLEQRDILENPPDRGVYDLVVLFGVLHHIPGYTTRLELMRRLGERVRPGGLLAFTTWRFYEIERLRERIVPWPGDITVELGDYLLDWRRGAVSLRYCHYADDAEHTALAGATGLHEILSYRADGQGNRANAYSLLKKV